MRLERESGKEQKRIWKSGSISVLLIVQKANFHQARKWQDIDDKTQTTQIREVKIDAIF